MTNQPPNRSRNETPIHADVCAFCRREREKVVNLIRGKLASICDDCAFLANAAIENNAKADKENKERKEIKDIKEAKQKEVMKLTPRKIVELLDEDIVGQSSAKRKLATGVYNHFKRVMSGADGIKKSNIVLVGSTGCGKTLLAETLAKHMGFPFVSVDATPLTDAGYVGEDVDSILNKLLAAADYDLEKASKGIVYIDEFDKLSNGGVLSTIESRSGVGRDGVQQALLKMVEGDLIEVKKGKAVQGMLDTKDILFIFGGAFSGIESIVKARLNKGNKGSIGFNVGIEKAKEKKGEVTHADLVKFGISPEMTGRIQVIANLQTLSEADLVRVLTEPKCSITKEYKKLLSFDNIALKFTKGALLSIAAKAVKNKTGARGLRTIVEDVMSDIMFEAPDLENVNAVSITKKSVEGKGSPILSYIEKKESVK